MFGGYGVAGHKRLADARGAGQVGGWGAEYGVFVGQIEL